jgi:hypothetical protein
LFFRHLNIQSFDFNGRLKGKDEIIVVDGIGIFDELYFISQPGNKNIKY